MVNNISELFFIVALFFKFLSIQYIVKIKSTNKTTIRRKPNNVIVNEKASLNTLKMKEKWLMIIHVIVII